MKPTRVLLDACVLAPITLCDVLLVLAEASLFDPKWSGAVLEETERTLVEKFGVPSEAARRRIRFMDDAFPSASVTGFEPLIEQMVNHPKDRHVLAAAVHGSCDSLVTANGKDFPAKALQPYPITVIHPDIFLSELLRADTEKNEQRIG